MNWIERFVENNITIEGLVVALLVIVFAFFLIKISCDDDDDFDVMG